MKGDATKGEHSAADSLENYVPDPLYGTLGDLRSPFVRFSGDGGDYLHVGVQQTGSTLQSMRTSKRDERRHEVVAGRHGQGCAR